MGPRAHGEAVAELLAVNERTIYWMANSGEPRGFKGLRFMGVDIRDWIEEQKKRAKDESDN